MFFHDNTKNADITTGNKKLREQTKCQKGSEGKGGKRKRKLLCFFLLGTFFLAKSGLKLDLLLAMGPGILPRTYSCSQATPACWSQCTLEKMRSKNVLLSKKVLCVSMLVCVIYAKILSKYSASSKV